MAEYLYRPGDPVFNISASIDGLKYQLQIKAGEALNLVLLFLLHILSLPSFSSSTVIVHHPSTLSLCRQAPLCLLDMAKHGMWHPVPAEEKGLTSQRVPTPREVKPPASAGKQREVSSL